VSPPSPLIRFVHVKKRFGPKVIFSDFNLEIAGGETLTVMGASGIGKSVMLKLLIGLIKPDAGEILADVQRIEERGENVAYGLREQFWNTMTEAEIQARVAQALDLVGLPGIQLMRPSDLSGGMKKRVGLARTLALQPQVILYDEPTTGLDPINTARINHLIRGIQRSLKVTSIVVTHDMGTAFSVSDRLAMIGRGRVLMVGTKEEFKATTNETVHDFITGHAPETEDVASLLSSS